MRIIRWQAAAKPQADELRQRMCQDGLAPYIWSSEPGDFFAVHSHNYEAVLYCVQGSICFSLPDTFDEAGNRLIIYLNAGDGLVLSAGIRHSARVGSYGVTCLEAARPLPQRQITGR